MRRGGHVAAAARSAWRMRLCKRRAGSAPSSWLLHAPLRRHVGWDYAHVPQGFAGDITALIEARIDRFAPGFRDTILARSVLSPAALESHDANNIGGHIIGGVADIGQLFTRPVARLNP